MTLITASRFDSMEEPEASAAQVRICAGGAPVCVGWRRYRDGFRIPTLCAQATIIR